MKKYSVRVTNPSNRESANTDGLEKKAHLEVSVCPECQAELEITSTGVPVCPVHGTEPFEMKKV